MYTLVDKKTFKKIMNEKRRQSKIRIFFDIETYQYNEDKGRKNPSEYKNCVYSVAISYYHKNKLYINIFPNFKEFFDLFDGLFTNKKKPSIELVAHNTNKYDNHFLRHDLIYYYGLPFENQYLMNASDDGNVKAIKIRDLNKIVKDKGIILEKRVKSRNNLELTFFLFGLKFYTTDNWIKTHTSIKSLGDRLKRLGVLTDEELKTDFDYEEFNRIDDLSDEESKTYALEIFNSLTDDHLQYIRNDVIILAKSCKYYSRIFKGFDYESITFTRNILDAYNNNELTNYQLLKTHGQGRYKMELKYTEFVFNGENLYDWLKSFYNGGLNFYNDRYIGQIIDGPVFGMDINSSYPAVMYKENIPTFLNSYEEFDYPTEVNIKEIESEENTYTLYRMTRQDYDYYVISRIESEVLKKMFVKYYNKDEYININSFTLKMIEDLTDIDLTYLPVLAYIKWDCVPFGSRDILEEFYRIKTQGQNKYKMNMEDINNIFETDEESEYIYTDEEIDIAKLNLNGLYGIPALRPYFNLFRWHGHDIVNIENGFMNSHRNIVFSTFVTSVSVYNLLYPLSFLSHKEIDENFLYCDTDSLYLKKEVVGKIPKSLFHPDNIGAWDIQNECIDYFYILNHKKYAYEENGEITVKAGGVPKNAFNTNMSFKEFISSQFVEGTKIVNTRSIFNKQETISIYPAITVLDLGLPYPMYSYNPKFNDDKLAMFKAIREYLNGHEEEAMYIESNLGTFSISDIYPIKHETNGVDLSYYKLKDEYFKSLINTQL